ncbi:transposable element Tcb1 transposase [Trichonephila clavipes]|nr:transposable element Tcb1 transposase [Trichonephila clavipes]
MKLFSTAPLKPCNSPLKAEFFQKQCLEDTCFMKETNQSIVMLVPRVRPVGCGSSVVKVSDHGRHGMSSIPVPLKTRRVGQRRNHQMARLVRHNDDSVREGYKRNGGKKVKLFTSAWKAFQCNNRIVMEQRKNSDDFLHVVELLDDGNVDVPS